MTTPTAILEKQALTYLPGMLKLSGDSDRERAVLLGNGDTGALSVSINRGGDFILERIVSKATGSRSI